MVEYKDGNVMDNAIGILAYPVNTRGAMEDEMGTHHVPEGVPDVHPYLQRTKTQKPWR